MKRRGFTLVEVLAVIVILSILAVITIPKIQEMIEDSRQSAYELAVARLEDKAYQYLLDNNLDSEITATTPVDVYVSDLIDAGYLDLEDIKDPRTPGNYLDPNTSYVRFYVSSSEILKNAHVTSTDTSPVNGDSTPYIMLLGSDYVSINSGSSYTDAGATAWDDEDGDLTSGIVISSNVNTSTAGTYYITYNVKDSNGNSARTVTRIVVVLDNTSPVITFGTSGNVTYAKTRSTTVTVSDPGGFDSTSLKYQWTTSSTAPSAASFSSVFTNGTSLNTPEGVTGGYYLWAMVSDPEGHTTISGTSVFNLDNSAPTLTINGSNPVTITLGQTYSDAGASATDSHSGMAGSVTSTGTVNINQGGTYTITYTATDNVGNTATATRTVEVLAVNYSGPGFITDKGVNGPILATGMTPIKWNGSAWVDTTIYDPNWYSYTTTDKKWANARTADGSMWVWIPRYIYKVTTGWHTSTTGTIETKFSRVYDDTIGGTITLNNNTDATASNNTWTNHTAFTFGTTQLQGIWVSKFEASGTSTTIESKPNVASYRNITIDNMFTYSRNMETNSRYGWGTSGAGIDTHLAKNVEWGAVVYLSKSTYGKNAEVWINNSSTYITGCAGNSASEASYGGCQNTYNTTNGQQASTTGNIYGIYDMSGGSYEYIASCHNVGTPSSFCSLSNQYYTKYVSGCCDSGYNTLNKGDAVYETANGQYWDGDTSIFGNAANWYGDYGFMTIASSSIIRGGSYSDTTTAGIFNYKDGTGSALTNTGFRPVLLVYNESPVITMLGSSPVSITAGSTYTDAGATASDPEDGNITANIQTTSNVNPSIAGTYTVTYNVTDSYGNAATTVTRTVNVTPAYTYVYNEGQNAAAWVVNSSTSGGYITITRTKESIDLLTTVSSSDEYTPGAGGWVTDNPVTLTGNTTLKIDSSYTGSCNYMTLQIGASKNVTQPGDPSVTINCSTPDGVRRITSLSISGMSGSYYIKYSLNVRGLETGTTKLFKVWLEP